MFWGEVVSWLVRSSPDWAFWVWALAGDIVLCSWARHFTLTVPLSTQDYKWVPANCWEKPNKLLGSDLRWTSIPSRGSRNTPSRFMLQKTRISSGSYEPVLAPRLHFFFLYFTPFFHCTQTNWTPVRGCFKSTNDTRIQPEFSHFIWPNIIWNNMQYKHVYILNYFFTQEFFQGS